MARNYAVVTGDIIGSRKTQDRMNLQVALQKCLDYINGAFREDIAIRFQITLGDEFQGLVVNLGAAPTITSIIREELYPISVRLAIGIGSIDTDLTSQISRMDGPAFHFSRAGMEQISKREGQRTAYITNDLHVNDILAVVGRLSDILLAERTNKQWEAIRLYRKEKKLKKVADRLGVKFQNVHKRLQAAHWDDIEQANHSLGKFLAARFSPNAG